MANDIGEEQAKQAAFAHRARTYPDWPNGVIQSVVRDGPHDVVTIMPENKMGILLFMVTYKFWVNASTGQVERMK